MFKYINLKKLTANTLVGILITGSFVIQSSENKALAASCGNNGHGNNAAKTYNLVTGNLVTGRLTIGGFDPSTSSSTQKDNLIADLDNGYVTSNSHYYIEYTDNDPSDGTGYSLTFAEATQMVETHPDWELTGNGATTILDCAGNDYDGDGINDAIELGSDFNNPIDTDGDGIPDYEDTDSDNDGINDGLEGTITPNMTGHLTADNHYGLFIGNDNGSDLNFIGRNEYGPSGNPGTYNWSIKEEWNFYLDDDDYIYVVVWDDANVDESWIGEFILDSGETLLSVEDSWEYIIASGSNPGDYGEVPSNSELQSEISSANWQSVNSRGDNGMIPWGTIAGISSDADFLNTTTPSNGNYTIFRTKFAVKPELSSSGETDSDGDGITDDIEIGADPDNPKDTDADGTPDYLDPDSDNNGIDDILEVGSDPNNPVDSDGDGLYDFQDDDDDNNGILDVDEIGDDSSSNPGYDLNGDGSPDIYPNDFDGDGIPDYLDPDSDGDTIPDSVEVGSDPNNPQNTDKDNPNSPAEPDEDPDYLDTDSDNDNIPDAVEAGDNNPNTPPINSNPNQDDGDDPYDDYDYTEYTHID